MKLRTSYISLAANVRWRKEHFGGILFHTETGTMIDVDREAYRFIELVQSLGIIDINDLDDLWFPLFHHHINRSEVIPMLKKLLELRILTLRPAGKLRKDYQDILPIAEMGSSNWPSSPVLSAPETVH